MAKKKPRTGGISIQIDPAIVAEMEAEAQKTPEQRQADKDVLFALMGNKMREMSFSMFQSPKKPTTDLKQKPKPDPDFDPNDLEIT